LFQFFWEPRFTNEQETQKANRPYFLMGRPSSLYL
jgi:hypothetical protein